MLSHTSVAVVVLVLATLATLATLAQASYYHSHSSRQATTYSRCSGSSSPCRLRYVERKWSGEVQSNSSSQQCSCNSWQGACPTNWNNPNRVISRNLRSISKNLTLSMMFCYNFNAKSVCADGAISMRMSGSMIIPTKLEGYFCKCSQSQPLYLKKRWMGLDYRWYHEYICSSDWGTCTTGRSCMSKSGMTTTYHCKCPSDKVCTYPSNQSSNAYCV